MNDRQAGGRDTTRWPQEKWRRGTGCLLALGFGVLGRLRVPVWFLACSRSRDRPVLGYLGGVCLLGIADDSVHVFRPPTNGALVHVVFLVCLRGQTRRGQAGQAGLRVCASTCAAMASARDMVAGSSQRLASVLVRASCAR